MGLRAKLFIPLICAVLVLLASIHWIVLPHFENIERTEHIEHIHSQLALFASSINEEVYMRDYGEIYVLLEKLQQLNPHWQRFDVVDAKGEIFYTFGRAGDVTVDDILELKYPLNYQNETELMLHVRYNLQEDLSEIQNEFARYQLYIAGFSLLILALLWTIIELTIIQPIRRLGKVSRKITNHEFNVRLPRITSDEVGELVRDFGAMRDAISDNRQELQQQIEAHREAERQITMHFRRQNLISAILKFSLSQTPLNEILQRTLEMLTALPQLSIESRGAIFLLNKQGALEMRASMRLQCMSKETCNHMGADECLCGQILENGKTLVITHVMAEHSMHDAGMDNHGHVIVPIRAEERILGVINLYLPADKTITEHDIAFIEDVAATLAGVLQRFSAEQALQTINNRLEQEVENRTLELKNIRFAMDQHSIIAITDAGGRITYVNDKFCEISKYSRDELLGRDHRLLNSAVHPREFFRKIWRTIGRGRVWHGEICNRAKDGSLYWVASTIVPFLDDEGKPYQYIAIRTDITQRIVQEQQLHRAHDAELSASRAKDEFLAVMSHEIRTPMNGMMGILDLLEDTPLTEEQQHYLTVARTASANLMMLLNQSLDYSKLHSGKLQLEEVVFDPGLLCTEIYNLYQAKADNKGLELRLERDIELPQRVSSDPLRVRQILCNLLDNAIKFTEQGYVSLTVQCVQDDVSQYRLRFEISDSGIGIPETMQNVIFTAFQQADSSITRRYGGTGLGLAIVEKLVKQLGGEINVISQSSVGTVFIVELPFLKPGSDPSVQQLSA